MTNGELARLIMREARRFSADGVAAIRRSAHLCGDAGEVTKEQCDAVIVAFANHLGFHLCCLDLALDVSDLLPPREETEATESGSSGRR
jgi:hypothetical protein